MQQAPNWRQAMVDNYGQHQEDDPRQALMAKLMQKLAGRGINLNLGRSAAPGGHGPRPTPPHPAIRSIISQPDERQMVGPPGTFDEIPSVPGVQGMPEPQMGLPAFGGGHGDARAELLQRFGARTGQEGPQDQLEARQQLLQRLMHKRSAFPRSQGRQAFPGAGHGARPAGAPLRTAHPY